MFTDERTDRGTKQSFLCETRRPDLKHIPIKLHEDTPNSYSVMARMFEKKHQWGIL